VQKIFLNGWLPQRMKLSVFPGNADVADFASLAALDFHGCLLRYNAPFKRVISIKTQYLSIL